MKTRIACCGRAQMHIQQTAFMLIALTLLFALVGVAVLGFKLSQINKMASGLEEENAKLLVTKLANSPEFSCGEAFGNQRTDCVDIDKALVLKQYSEKYKDFWGVTDIKIRKIFPSENVLECSLNNYPNCNTIGIISEENIGSYVSNFVALCRKENKEGIIYDKCEIGLLMVSYENEN